MARPPPAPFPPEPGPGEFPNAPNLQTLPELPISSLGDDWVVDFEELQAYNKAGVAGKRTKVLNEQWLASEKDWKYRVGKGWKGKKVLGQGGQGIVGHWTYEGPDRDQKTVKDIAIKQAVRFGGNTPNIPFHFLIKLTLWTRCRV
jgi:hypothetical protein